MSPLPLTVGLRLFSFVFDFRVTEPEAAKKFFSEYFQLSIFTALAASRPRRSLQGRVQGVVRCAGMIGMAEKTQRLLASIRPNNPPRRRQRTQCDVASSGCELLHVRQPLSSVGVDESSDFMNQLP